MNKFEQIQYLLEKSISVKDRFYRLGSLSRVAAKEKPETWYALEKYREYIKPNFLVAELGAGHGLLGTWLAWLGLCHVELFDTRYKNKLPIGYKTALIAKPYLNKYVKINGRHLIYGDEGIDADCIVAVHACGNLSDYALRAAVAKRIPIAIMTCCHGKDVTNTPRCSINLNLIGIGIKNSSAIDIDRAAWLSSQNYKVSMTKIRDGITGEPRIILGKPL